ncbi:hypothetical protein CWB96_11090 [Pseudoalteromonas citrea]|uniref:LicD family protein n=1 Tax=Pseudoalteromonas citrea TaxID=43655 RepID=A0A5S3XPF1_9GAMM|nr:hypothetical protein [Pseudoalteromonas citrea]TMP45722.1 hypothetical protein CWB97_03735 [Pseudoalteromonas citrea]TMP59101.1 hypothetical protein CWB96_11090 [Pseudoalteromonas citrea]
MYFIKKLRYNLVSVLIRISKFNSSLEHWFDNYRSKAADNHQKADVSHYYKDIIRLINESEINAFPMFGTLLSIYRDREFVFADDYDFALKEGYELDLDLISRMGNLGALLVGYSVVGKRLVELSFDFNSIRIDLFKLDYFPDGTIHRCPNFRKERASVYYSDVVYKKYTTCFVVRYEKIELRRDIQWNLDIPINCEDIFINHYGSDWHVPKKSNFIDFEKYQFMNVESYVVEGEHELLLNMLYRDDII